MKKLILSALLFSVSAGSYAQKLPGTADSTFNGNGYGIYKFGDVHAQLGSGYIDQNGKFVVLGSSYDAGNKVDAGITRINLDGSEDMTFRMNSGPSHIDFNSGNHDYFNAFTKCPDGGIMAVGGFSGPNGADLLVVKFNQEGTIQTSFGLNGVFKYEVDPGYETASHILVDKNDRPVIFGNLPIGPKKMYIMRLHPYGGLDSNFSTDGILYIDPLGVNNTPVAIFERPNGGYYIVCNSAGNGETLITVHSVSENGNTNIDLGGPGEVNLKVDGGSAQATDAVFHNGSIFICGNYQGPQNNQDGFLARLEVDGTWNATFAGTGFARIIHNLSNPYDEEVAKMVIAPDSSIFIASISNTPDTLTLIQSRFKSDGNVEGLYGNHNGSHYDFAIADSVNEFSIYDIVLDTGSKRLYVLGSQSSPSHNGFFVYAAYTGEFKQASSGGSGTGIRQNASLLKVYPNPSNGIFNIDIETSNDLEISVYTISGQLVKQQATDKQIDLRDLDNGLYFMMVKSADTIYTSRVQINK